MKSAPFYRQIIQCKYQNPLLGIALKDWRTVYQLWPTPQLLQPEVYRGKLFYRLKESNRRISYDRIKAGLVKKGYIVTLEVPFCPF